MLITTGLTPSRKERIKVVITSDTTKAQLEQAYPMLSVKTDDKGQYIRTPHCRFVPGTYFLVSSSGIPTYYSSK